VSSDWCELGAASIENGVLSARCKGGAVDEDGTAPDYGAIPMMCALGVTAVPYPPTKEGAAEGKISHDVPGLNGVIDAARDTRTAAAIGNPKPGTSILHSTGPQQAAQVQCIEDTRMVALLTKGDDGKTMMLLLDGSKSEFQLTLNGFILKVEKNGDFSMLNASGAGIIAQGSNVGFGGTLNVGAGGAPPGSTLLCGIAPSPGGVASLPNFQVLGVAVR
jgi:hypothetical protein